METMNPRLEDPKMPGLDTEDLAAWFGASRKPLAVVLPGKRELLS